MSAEVALVPQISVQTRWRDVFAGDRVVDNQGEVWSVESITSMPSQLRIRLAMGGRKVNLDIDRDELINVLQDDPAAPGARPRVVPCPTCHGRGKVRNGGAG